jgi:uncharacterized membrane protein
MSQPGIPGLSKARLEALCDGIFAIVMTLLVLEIALPPHGEVHTDRQLFDGILHLWPKIVSYAASFMLLASFWFAHHFEFGYFRRTDRRHLWINILFMLVISFVPVSTAMLGEFFGYRTGVAVYAANMTLAGLVLLWNWRYATKNGRLTVENFPDNVRKALTVRLLLYPALFFAAGALSLINVVTGFILCVAVPLVYIAMQVIPHAIDRQHPAAPQAPRGGTEP